VPTDRALARQIDVAELIEAVCDDERVREPRHVRRLQALPDLRRVGFSNRLCRQMVAIVCRFGAPTMASASPHYEIGFLRLWRRAEKQLACQTAGMGLPDGGWVESAMPQIYP
jgi:hypothetical protein